MKTTTHTTFNIDSTDATSSYNSERFNYVAVAGVLDYDEFCYYRNHNLDDNSYPIQFSGLLDNIATGEIFPVQAYASNTIITGLLAKEGVPPSLNPPPISGYASEIKVSPEKAETTPNSVKMSPSLIAKIKELAALEGTNCSQFIIRSIEYYLQNLDTLIPIEIKDDTALDTFTHIAFQLNCLTKELNILNKYSRDLSTLELEEKRQVIISLIKNGLEFISSENKMLLLRKRRHTNGK